MLSRRFRPALLTLVLLICAVCTVPGQLPGIQPQTVQAQSDLPLFWTLVSPDGRLELVVFQAVLGPPYPPHNGLYYRVFYDGELVVADSPLGLTTTTSAFVGDLIFIERHEQQVGADYKLPSGKRYERRDVANQQTLSFITLAGRPFEIILRAYDDGFAFRYRLPGAGAEQISAESSGFRLPDGATFWAQAASPDYEGLYFNNNFSGDLPRGDRSFPLLYTTGTRWALLTEAAVDNSYGASRLTAYEGNRGLLQLKLPDYLLSWTLPWETPWRVGIVGADLAAIVESTLVDSLNPPAATIPTWVKPGRVAWSWWSDSESPKSYAAQQASVDFAARMGWEYVLVDEGWSESWLPTLASYAARRKVGIIVWARWTDLDTAAERRQRLVRWKSWGVRGIKVDFIKSDSQRRMQFYEEIAQATWDNQLMLSFHGSTLPRGQQRRWPQIMTWEAVYGAEYYKFDQGPTPTHNTVLPFTRNAVGPMDYTPVTFSAAGRTTSAAHELALAVVFQSDWQHFADSPATYERSRGLALLREVPSRWDDTILLDGYPGAFAALARRSGRDWYVGIINGEQQRALSLPLEFLGPGTYQATLYADGPGDQIVVANLAFGRENYLSLPIAARSGLVVKLTAPSIKELPFVPGAYLPLVLQ